MAVLKPRNRLVYFRVSEEEFQLFTDMCQIEGARSISDLARLALQRLAQERRLNTEDDFLGKLRAINEVLTELGDKVERLKTQLELADGANGKEVALSPLG
jgi:dynactin complex subunit